jgi:hypothetical protein
MVIGLWNPYLGHVRFVGYAPIASAQVKLAATTLGIKKLEIGPNGGRVIFRPQPNVEPLTIIKMIQAQPRVYALDGQDKLRFKMPMEGTAERLRGRMICCRRWGHARPPKLKTTVRIPTNLAIRVPGTHLAPSL